MRTWTGKEKIDISNPVVTIGIFDGVHQGHAFLLEKLKEEAKSISGESLVFTLWPHPRLVLNKDPENLKYLSSLEEKKYLIEKAGIDHLVVVPFTIEFSKLDSCDFIKKYLIDLIGVKKLIIGFNHKFGNNREGDFENLKECASQYNFQIERMPSKSINDVKISSSLIRELLNSGNLSLANEYLGYDYFLHGSIVGGNRIGRKIGFPTANIMPDDPHKLIPRDGVYAVHLELNGRLYPGMLNVGFRPTIESGMSIKTLEVNLFDFKEDIYNKQVHLYFRSRIRDEKKFEGIEQLREQLVIDREISKRILGGES
ncbi:MAG: bifunctional riboflavin kinase/FAD synthetase [Bacteroidales bacterium]|nr:bifunctional riboflavin kinase/FAD synthetase [Bacteroidales bacterium]MCB8998626.1 bifunctional riboflavin kinase/FAD synthetase [Bacteroidales bacterium]MCB9012506.1 bifunctional riboflavin kinase/FAD synthetase [Bacteroidales bacterium]